MRRVKTFIKQHIYKGAQHIQWLDYVLCFYSSLGERHRQTCRKRHILSILVIFQIIGNYQDLPWRVDYHSSWPSKQASKQANKQTNKQINKKVHENYKKNKKHTHKKPQSKAKQNQLTNQTTKKPANWPTNRRINEQTKMSEIFDCYLQYACDQRPRNPLSTLTHLSGVSMASPSTNIV